MESSGEIPPPKPKIQLRPKPPLPQESPKRSFKSRIVGLAGALGIIATQAADAHPASAPAEIPKAPHTIEVATNAKPLDDIRAELQQLKPPSKVYEPPIQEPTTVPESAAEKELKPFNPNVTIIDAAPDHQVEGIIQDKFINNDDMIKNMLGDKYIPRAQLIQEFGADYEQKWREITDKYPQAILYLYADTYLNHGKDVAEVMEKTWNTLGLQSTGIDMLPLQSSFSQENVKFSQDNLGNVKATITFDPQNDIALLKNDPNLIISGSYEEGDVDLIFEKRFKDIPNHHIPSPQYEENTTGSINLDKIYVGDNLVYWKQRDKEVPKTPQGQEITPISVDEYKRMVDNAKAEARKNAPIIEAKKAELKIVGAYDKTKAIDNLPKLFELCNAYPDKLFVRAAGNTGEDFREAFKKLGGNIPNNLILVAEWDSLNGSDFKGRPRHNVQGDIDNIIYVHNSKFGAPEGSSFSTPIISAYADVLSRNGFTIEEIRKQIFEASDIVLYRDDYGLISQARVFNPDLLTDA